ncbi:MAG: bifunctional adenosylcobinamide kinase/adenosylcobinamide-phosphate guanylyltransferase [Kutzneria sp.]|nr:bifunctional adenosylcobinamide kinase/adenosylcobinamide-phosphate guanylyltransferase [Kutzneria sp.]
MKHTRTLVLGGARSGKSAHAEGLVAAGDEVTYVATGRRNPADKAWEARIAAHVLRRPSSWRTVETTDLVSVFADTEGTLVVDDIATWLTCVLDDTNAWDGELAPVRRRVDELVDAVCCCPNRIVLVSAEVGLGVVPSTRSGRLFRDELGALNARLAEVCHEVLLLVTGIPLRLR